MQNISEIKLNIFIVPTFSYHYDNIKLFLQDKRRLYLNNLRKTTLANSK
jgi:hypothetical protein